MTQPAIAIDPASRTPARLETVDGPALDWFGSPLRFPVTCADTGGLMSIQIADLAPGAHTPLHCHGREDELFIVLEGRFEAEVAGKHLELRTGDAAFIPRGVPHRVLGAANEDGAGPTRVATVLTPGSLEDAFRTVANQGGSQLREVFAEAGVEFAESFRPEYRHPEAGLPAPPVIVRAGEGERCHMAGDTYTIMFGGRQTSGRLNLIHFEVPPGGGPIPHLHTADDEVFVVTRGKLALFHDGHTTEASVGDIAVLPRGSIHAFRNDTTETAEMLALTAPAQFDALIRAVGVPATPGSTPKPIGDAEKARMAQAAPRFGIELHPEAWGH